MVKVALNGYGRIGQSVFRIWAGQEDKKFDIVMINGMASAEDTLAKLKYDSVYGRFDGEAEVQDDYLIVNGKKVLITNERDTDKLPWKLYGVDIVIDCTGKFRTRETAQHHIDKGAKKVIITAPTKHEDITIVMGVNEEKYEPENHHIISNASCTTNCLAPFAKVIDEEFGIEYGMMNTVHAYTNGQNITDGKNKDPRRARAAAINIIPTTTGAAQAVSLVLPQLKGRFTGIGIRVPVPTVSLVDMVVTTKKPVTVEKLNTAFKDAANGKLKGILGYSEEPLVSSDYIKDSRSSIVDGLCTETNGDNMCKILAWYDNEYGYSTRVVDLTNYIIEKGL